VARSHIEGAGDGEREHKADRFGELDSYDDYGVLYLYANV
jgi:hypothetical protein